MFKLNQLVQSLRQQKCSSRDLVEQCLEQIESPEGEGARALLTVYKERAQDQADHIDGMRKKGWKLPDHNGIPITIKDLFDTQGEVTRAASHVLDDQAPAKADAPVVTSLRNAGFIILGKANMTEFAFSGLGINAHYGTPRNPYDRLVQDDSFPVVTGRIPGGSSSGGAVSVSDGMAAATIGTDTGGSCRIPAAFCGIVGYKPTASRVSTAGAVPLSKSLDSIGPLANSVDCCRRLDTIISGTYPTIEHEPEYTADGLRIGVLKGYATENLDDTVATNFYAALSRLLGARVHLNDLTIRELEQFPTISRKGSIVGAEAYAWHQKYLKQYSNRYDPWVKARIEVSANQTAADYIDLLNFREWIKGKVAHYAATYDALALPTVQIIPPTMASLTDNEDSIAINQLCLKNTAIGNMLDHPAISIPCHEAGSAPTGFMLMATRCDDDARLLAIADSLESIIRVPA